MSERVLPHPAPSVWRGWALSLLSSAVANELLRLAATSAFPVTSFEPLTRPAVFLWTAVGATGAALVFAALPPLLLPAGRVLVEVAGKGEAALAQRWLREAGLLQVGAEQAGSPTGFPPRGRGGTDTATATGGRS